MEAGAVALDLKDAHAVREAISRMKGERYLVQKMAPPGYEVIVGEKGTGCTIVDAKIEVVVAPTRQL